MIDGIPEEDFDDIGYDYDEEDMKKKGCKVRHVGGTEGVLLSSSGGYSWVGHSGGQESFIFSGELLFVANTCTSQELEEYLGHANGLEQPTEASGSKEEVAVV